MIPPSPLGPSFRLGPTRYYKAYGSYDAAATMQRCHVDEPGIWLDAGRGGEMVQLPAEPFTLHVRLGDVVRCAHAKHGQLHPGDGRPKHGRSGRILADAPWVVVNMDDRTARVVEPRGAGERLRAGAAA